MKVKIFININVLIFENIDLAIFIYINYTKNYRIIFNLIILFLRLFIKREMRFKKKIIIIIYFYITIFIENIKLFFDDYILKLINKYLVILFIIIVNDLSHFILIRNNFENLILLFYKF